MNRTFTLLVAGMLLAVTTCPDTVGQEQATGPANRTRVMRIPPEPLKGAPPAPEHPLHSVLQFAEQHYHYLQKSVRDYTCLLVKRERMDGELLPREYIQVKCRHARTAPDGSAIPFSVYMRFLAPADLAGREALYVEGRDRGDVLIRKGGRRNAFLNLWLDPEGETAMRANRYPITEFGIEKLLFRLMEVGERDLQYGECDVRYYRKTVFDNRECTGIEVQHPVPRAHFRYHTARVMIDNELHVPVYFAAFDWPREPGEPPRLIEEYIYRDIKLNSGLRDVDFDRLNPQYGFRKE